MNYVIVKYLWGCIFVLIGFNVFFWIGSVFGIGLKWYKDYLVMCFMSLIVLFVILYFGVRG